MEATDSFWGNIFKKDEQTPKTVIDRLKEVSLFSRLSRRELEQVADITHIRTYKSGETIFYQGDPGVGMYIIEQGNVAIILNLPDNGKLTLAELSEGHFFGELALLNESPRSADAVAQTDSTVIGFFRPDLFGLLERRSRLGGKIIVELAKIIGARLRNSNEEIQQLKVRLAELEKAHKQADNSQLN